MGHTRTHTRQGDKHQRALETGGAGGLPPSLSAAPREGPGGLPAPALRTRGRRGVGPQDDLSTPASFGQGTDFHLLCSLTWPQSGGRPEQGSQREPAPQYPSPTSPTAMGGLVRCSVSSCVSLGKLCFLGNLPISSPLVTLWSWGCRGEVQGTRPRPVADLQRTERHPLTRTTRRAPFVPESGEPGTLESRASAARPPPFSTSPSNPRAMRTRDKPAVPALSISALLLSPPSQAPNQSLRRKLQT